MMSANYLFSSRARRSCMLRLLLVAVNLPISAAQKLIACSILPSKELMETSSSGGEGLLERDYSLIMPGMMMTLLLVPYFKEALLIVIIQLSEGKAGSRKQTVPMTSKQAIYGCLKIDMLSQRMVIITQKIVIQISPIFPPQPPLYTPFSNFKLRLTVIYNLNSTLPSTKMSLQKDDPFGSRSRQTTEEDSSSDRDEELFCPRTNPAKHKTELCKTYSQLGHCPYEHKCRFAHGRHELIHAPPKAASKNRKCNGFWKNGCCSYGIRCQFGHSQSKWQARAVLSGLQAANQHYSAMRTSKLMQLLQ